MKQPSLVSVVSIFIFLGVHAVVQAQQIGQAPGPFEVEVFLGDGAGDTKQLLEGEEFAKPRVLIFINKPDVNVLELVKKLNVVAKEAEKDAYVVYLSGDSDDLAKVVLEVAKLPMPIYKYAGEDPAGYEKLRQNAMTVVMCADSKIAAVDRLSTETLEDKEKKTASATLLKFYRLVTTGKID